MSVLKENPTELLSAACLPGGEQAAELVYGWELNPELQELAALGDAPAVAEILRIFLDDAEQQIEMAERAMRREDCASVGNAAHTLSGSSATIGLQGFSLVARQMQMLAQSQKLAESRERLEDLRRQIPAAKRVSANSLQNSNGNRKASSRIARRAIPTSDSRALPRKGLKWQNGSSWYNDGFVRSNFKPKLHGPSQAVDPGST